MKGTWLNIFRMYGDEKITICNLYRSPNSSVSHFCINIIKVMEELLDTSTIVVVGDFNIDISKGNCYYGNKIINEMVQLGFKQKIDKPTRSTITSDTIIDLVFANIKIETKVLIMPKITDHNIIEIRINQLTNNKKKPIETYSRNYKKFDNDVFNKLLLQKMSDIRTMNETDYSVDVDNYNALVDKILSNIIGTLDIVTPVTKKTIRTNWEKKPWISSEIVNKMKNRDRAFYIAKASKNYCDMLCYKRLRNKIVEELRKNKKAFYENKIDKNKLTPKLL